MSVVIMQMRHLLLAVSLLTRIPIKRLDLSKANIAAATLYFPLIGAGIGALGGLVFIISHFYFSSAVSVVLTLGFLMLLTGALHEDGLADSFDAFGSKTEKGDILEVMRDSRIGVYGSSALLVVLLLKYASLGSMRPETVPLALLVGHMVSRWAMLLPTVLLPYPRASASWTKRFVESVADSSKWNLAITTLYTWVSVTLLLRVSGLIIMGMASVTGLLGVVYFKRRLGGATGDCYGALQQVSEVSVYLLLLELL